MIDSGADRDVLSLQIVKKLDLPTEKMLMRVHTVNCEVVEEKVLASFILSSIDEEYNVHISNALTGELLTGEADIAPCQRDFTSQSHLRNVPFPKVKGTCPIDHRRRPLRRDDARGGKKRSIRIFDSLQMRFWMDCSRKEWTKI